MNGRRRDQPDDLEAQVERLVRNQRGDARRLSSLDREARLYRRLFELGQRISGSLNLQAILHEIPAFATRELGFERAALFLDDRDAGSLTSRSMDGYFTEDERRRVSALKLPATAAFCGQLGARKEVLHRGGGDDPALCDLTLALGMDEMLAFPFFNMKKGLIGFLAAGRRGVPYTGVDDPAGATGLRSLTEQANWAINHCILYWDLAVERNMLEARIAERTSELKATYALMKEDLLQAREFQQSILPPPQRVPGMELEVIYRPLDLVGGDIYDVMSIADGPIRVLLADATGHGVRASLTTMLIMGEYDRVKHAGQGPASALRSMNDEIARSFGHLAMHFTAICLDFDQREGVVTYATAAAPPPCLVHRGQPRELESGGPFVGLRSEIAFPEWRVSLAADDVLCLYTDGLFEEWDSQGEQFGTERVLGALAAATQSGQPLGASACAELDRFMGGRPLSDDVTCLTMRWTPRD